MPGNSLLLGEAADYDLERRTMNFLVARHRPALRQLEVEARNGVVTLRGRVGSFYEKQLALHCCLRVAGVLKLIDAIDVSPAAVDFAVG